MKKCVWKSAIALSLSLSVSVPALAASVDITINEDRTSLPPSYDMSYVENALENQGGYATDTDFNINMNVVNGTSVSDPLIANSGAGAATSISGIYRHNADISTGNNTIVIFSQAGTATSLTSTINGATTQSYVAGLDSYSAGNLVTKDNVITVTSLGGISIDNVSGNVTETSDYRNLAGADAYGIRNQSANSNTKTGNNIITVTAKGGEIQSQSTQSAPYGDMYSRVRAHGIANDGIMTTLDNKMVINATGGKNTSVGSNQDLADTYAYGIKNTLYGSLNVGNNNIEINIDGGSSNTTGAVKVTAASVHGYGILSESKSTAGSVSVKDNFIKITSKAGVADSKLATSWTEAYSENYGLYNNSTGAEGSFTAGKNQIIMSSEGGVANADKMATYAYAFNYGIYNKSTGSSGALTTDDNQIILSAKGGETTSSSSGNTSAYAQNAGVVNSSTSASGKLTTGNNTIVLSAIGGSATSAKGTTAQAAKATTLGQGILLASNNDIETKSNKIQITGTAGESKVTGTSLALSNANSEGYGIYKTGAGNLKTADNEISIDIKGGIASADSASSSNVVASAFADGVSNRNTSGNITTGSNWINIVAAAGESTAGANTSGQAIARTEVHGVLNNSSGMMTTEDNIVSIIAAGGTAISDSATASAANASSSADAVRGLTGGTVITGNNTIQIKSTGGTSGGNAQYANSTSSIAGVMNNSSTVTTGDNLIILDSTGGTSSTNGANGANSSASASGIQDVGTTTVKSNQIVVKAKGGTATGSVSATAASTAIGMQTINGALSAIGSQYIYTESVAGLANGLTDKAYAYALYANGGLIDIQNQGKAVQLTGDIGIINNGQINLALDNAASYWRPRFQDELNGAVNGSFGTGGLTLKDGGTLDLAWSSNQNGNQFLDRNLTISGSNVTIGNGATFIVNADIANNVADTVTIASSSLIGGTATGTQYIQVAYDPAMDQDGTVYGKALVLDFNGANAQGLATETETPLGNYFVTVGVENDYANGKSYLVSLTRTSEVSQLGKSASDMYRHQANILRLQASGPLVRRLGELRSEGSDNHYGAWARSYGGKLKSDGAYGSESSQKYYAFQAGFDWIAEQESGKYLFGLLVDRMNSDSDFRYGDGKIKSTAFGGYLTWLSDKGHYADFVLKAAHMDTNYDVTSLSGRRSSADFTNWGYSMNLEYGYYYNVTPSDYIVPQAEMSLGYLEGKDYTSSDGLLLKQGSLNMAIGRLGVLYGHSFGENNRSNAYIRGSVLHDFSSSGSLEGIYNDARRKIETADDFGTSFELNLGTNIKVSDNNKIYAEVTKVFGGDVKTDFQVNAGWRTSW